MALSLIDINAMASAIYDIIMNTLKTAEEMVGLDTLWCRALPHQNGEDVILQEYTLSNVDCPHELKVILDKNDYQPGMFSLDMYGMTYENPLEISINIDSWKAVYGENTAPQKGDIVLIKVYNRLYEVATMTVHYMLQSVPQYYKCSLTKYQRKASRRENQELKISIDELTTDQSVLFGDAISNEVADAVIERETAYKTTTSVDPICTCDLLSVICEDIVGANGNLISSAYYNFGIAEKNVKYTDIDASYLVDKNDINTHWILTEWFRIGHNKALALQQNQNTETDTVSTHKDDKTYNFTFTNLYLKDKNYYYFTYVTTLKLAIGDNVLISRGSLFSFTGIVDDKDCSSGYVIKIPINEVLAANKKSTLWWKNIKNGWKIKKLAVPFKTETEDTEDEIASIYNLFTAYNDTDKKISINTDTKNIIINFNNIKKTISLKKELVPDTWHYICVDVNVNKVDIKLVLLKYNSTNYTISDSVILDKTYNTGVIKGFNINNCSLENKGMDMNICNLRFYESEYEMGANYKIDMYSEVTRNASKLIIVDQSLPSDTASYISQIL